MLLSKWKNCVFSSRKKLASREVDKGLLSVRSIMYRKIKIFVLLLTITFPFINSDLSKFILCEVKEDSFLI